jgi:hypothetical protein
MLKIVIANLLNKNTKYAAASKIQGGLSFGVPDGTSYYS